jgi:hypothetical protein
MRSSGHGAIVGNVNLKGKKEKTLDCKCCAVFNLKEREKKKQVKKEIAGFTLLKIKD